MAATIQTIQKPTRARALDTSGNNNHGQIYSGRGLEFDGVTDYLQVSTVDNTEIGMTTTSGNTSAQDNRTVAVWIKPTTSGTFASHQSILYAAAGGGADGYGLLLYGTGAITMEVDDGTNRHQAISTLADHDFRSNTWRRIVAVFDAVNFEMTLYVNGEKLIDAVSHLGAWNGDVTPEGNIVIGAHYDANTYPYDGQMSDFQVWNGLFTADDALYDYNNPEQLALNRGGTSLTESNLKLWYPMQDGHRGQQSFILDGSNLGLGDEMVTNGGFDADSNWTKSSAWSIDSGVAHYDASAVNQIEQTVSMTTGNTYRVTFTISNGTTARIALKNNGANYPNFYESLTNGTHTYYITALGTDFEFWGANTSGGASFDLDNISIKPINAKNHATTVFYGDEQISDVNDRTFAAGGNWVGANANGSNTTNDFDTFAINTTSGATEGTYFTDNYLKIICASDGSNVKFCHLDGANWEDADGDAPAMVVGRTYQISFSMQITAFASGTLSIGMGTEAGVLDADSDFQHTSGTYTAKTQTIDFVYTGTTSHARLLIHAATSTAFTAYFDNFSIKEVGTATGWTDADQQLDIPQTALQSYNQLAWFNGKGGLDASSVSATSGVIAPITPLTFSCWFSGEHTGQSALIRHATWNENGYIISIKTNDNTEVTIQTHHGTTHTEASTTAGTKDLLTGEFNHIVVVIDQSESSRAVYINGALMEEITSGFSYDVDGTTSSIQVGKPITTGNEFDGIINEVSIWQDSFTLAEVQELYNDGKALDATTHSAESNLKGYWRNNGLATWADRQDNITANNLTVNNGDQTILIPAGVDGSRDNQGFLMNRQRTTNSLNLDGRSYVVVNDEDTLTMGAGDYTVEFWLKRTHLNETIHVLSKYKDSEDYWWITLTKNNDLRFLSEVGDTIILNCQVDDDDSGNFDWGDLDVWHHYAITIERAASADVNDTELIWYIDGVAFDGTYEDRLNTTTSIDIDGNLAIGTQYSGSVGTYAPDNQIIDGVAIYGKKLEATEVKRNYNAGKRSHR